MGNTSTLVKIPISNEQLLNQVEELKSLLPERERQLLQLNQQLNQQINTLTKERDNLAGQVKSFDTWRQDLLNKTQKQIQQKEQEHRQSKAIITGLNRSREEDMQRELDNKNREIKILRDRETEIKEREAKFIEQEKLLKSRETELKELREIKDKLDFLIDMNKIIIDTVNKGNNKILELLSKPDITVGDIKKQVKQNEKTLTTNINTKQRVQNENEYILRGLMSGKTQKQIADELWPDISSRYSKMCERLKTKWFDNKIRA